MRLGEPGNEARRAWKEATINMSFSYPVGWSYHDFSLLYTGVCV